MGLAWERSWGELRVCPSVHAPGGSWGEKKGVVNCKGNVAAQLHACTLLCVRANMHRHVHAHSQRGHTHACTLTCLLTRTHIQHVHTRAHVPASMVHTHTPMHALVCLCKGTHARTPSCLYTQPRLRAHSRSTPMPTHSSPQTHWHSGARLLVHAHMHILMYASTCICT